MPSVPDWAAPGNQRIDMGADRKPRINGEIPDGYTSSSGARDRHGGGRLAGLPAAAAWPIFADSRHGDHSGEPERLTFDAGGLGPFFIRSLVRPGSQIC